MTLDASDHPTTIAAAEDEAKRSLAIGFSSSIRWGGAVFGGMVAVSTAVGGSFFALGKLTGAVCVALGTMTVASAGIAIVVAEFSRLATRSRALREVLRAGRYYESVLVDARQERDKFRLELETLKVTILTVGSVQALLQKSETSDD